MCFDNEKVNSLIQMIYDAALEDTLWPSVIHELALLVNAEDSLLFSPYLVENNPLSPLSVLSPYDHADINSWNAYSSYFWQSNVWEQGYRKMGMQTSGCIIQGDQVIERSAFRQTEMYCDFLKPMHSGMGVNLVAILFDESTSDQSPQMQLSLCKPSFAEAFTQQDEHLLLHLIPHLQRALRIRWKMANEQQIRQLREQALDQMANPILLLDAAGRIIYANFKAELLLRKVGNPTVIHGQLCSLNAYENNTIKEALRLALTGVGSTLRFDNNSPCIATFSPITVTRGEYLNTSGRVMVIFDELNKPTHENLEGFAKLYKLTTAETRVLNQILQSQSTKEITESLKISMTTLRTQLRALFIKTQTKNQRELIQFCLSHLIISAV
jgi:DNA-binding CsgD family transcriptional regulator/PAS domain-containing protein